MSIAKETILDHWIGGIDDFVSKIMRYRWGKLAIFVELVNECLLPDKEPQIELQIFNVQDGACSAKYGGAITCAVH